jgi:predicted RNA-binding protein with PIN domain
VPEPTLYLFDGYNLLHAADSSDVRALRDRLASFVAVRGARGVLVFDGHGADETHGALAVRYADDADALIERLAVERRTRERVCVVSSDVAVHTTSGQEVSRLSSAAFLAQLGAVEHDEKRPSPLRDRLDEDVRERLERLRRGSA